MIIEPLDAANGDAALVRHTGTSGDQVIGMVDGGPSSTLARSIAPALETHGITPQAGGLDWLCVSHVDSDHIGGVLSLVRHGYSVDRFLYNTPSPFPGQDVAPASGPPGGGSPEAELARLVRPAEQDDVLPASYKQGQDLLDLVIDRGIQILNPPDNERLLTGADLDIDGLTVQVVSPSAGRINALLAAWAAAVRAGVTPASSKEMDDSITNLSSLTLLLMQGDRKALFTGDALEDDVVAGLKALGHQLPMHVDVLKVPHHGSNSAANPASLATGDGLIENVTADFYIVSADGTSTNPTPATLERIVAMQDSACTIVLPSPTEARGGTSEEHYATTVAGLLDLASAAPAAIDVLVGQPTVIDLS
jgi:beta-lactamase superfamily II metal-dependent hydrolase